jgi:hypothetical protein
MYRTLASVLAIGLALMLWALPGCGKKAVGQSDAEVLDLEFEAIDLAPGMEKPVKVTFGKAVSVESPKNTGVDVKLADDKILISAAPNAKKGRHTVTVIGRSMKNTVVVNVGVTDTAVSPKKKKR